MSADEYITCFRYVFMILILIRNFIRITNNDKICELIDNINTQFFKRNPLICIILSDINAKYKDYSTNESLIDNLYEFIDKVF